MMSRATRSTWISFQNCRIIILRQFPCVLAQRKFNSNNAFEFTRVIAVTLSQRLLAPESQGRRSAALNKLKRK